MRQEERQRSSIALLRSDSSDPPPSALPLAPRPLAPRTSRQAKFMLGPSLTLPSASTKMPCGGGGVCGWGVGGGGQGGSRTSDCEAEPYTD